MCDGFSVRIEEAHRGQGFERFGPQLNQIAGESGDIEQWARRVVPKKVVLGATKQRRRRTCSDRDLYVPVDISSIHPGKTRNAHCTGTESGRHGFTRNRDERNARMMGIADIFEALTARDRPYKAGMKLSQAMGIMTKFKETGHIDPDLFDVFVTQGVYRRYAESFLDPQQLDITA